FKWPFRDSSMLIGVSSYGKSLKTVPVVVRENGCGTEAAAKSTWMYLRRFSRNAAGGIIVR
ncbi:hypothetical protein, partial [Thiolapillus sp.]|uniref:hypothetical protein n=1 Tax=Thiolapillus sp. TaxID=2017437 RepID=UPI003AF55719